ncbi:GTPase activating protein of Rab-like GTPase [Trypanosoma grayi]|uniref:GTPase activating protein of Rab-like GTPase n=1 Tax=Trypanosoma grayi TaxID=71804 RepID=UPI0004F42947|nr:GTPase activating protein of Rab-like GTPase [Trypanosoma grayi]KEG14605.1 GTPase activating protein of Rab-like GTPase [Trypanosoma grayi]
MFRRAIAVRTVVTLAAAEAAAVRVGILSPAIRFSMRLDTTSKATTGASTTEVAAEAEAEAGASTVSVEEETPGATKVEVNAPRNPLYVPFMGSSSRFTFANPISKLEELTALESEPLSHSPPGRVNDHCCIYLVKLLRWCADKLFRERYMHRATMLKVMAPASPFAGAMITFLRMMFKKKGAVCASVEGGFALEVRGLLTQAESHACHAHILMLMTEITYMERAAALILQAGHFIIFFILFLVYPRMAYRLMGYLGEESVVIWTHMINDIDLRKVSERNIPQAALDYWSLHRFKTAEVSLGDLRDANLPEQSEESRKAETPQNEDTSTEAVTLRDVILLLRSDEMVWRDACHRMANDIDRAQGKGKSFFSSFFS